MPSGSTIGEVRDEEIAALWQQREVPPKDAGATPFSRFCIHVTQLISLRTPQAETGDFAVFLMSENLSSDSGVTATDHMPLLENGNDAISGFMWLVPPTIKDAYRLKLECKDQTKIIADIMSAGFGARPAILFDRRGDQPKAHAYAKGVVMSEERDMLIIEERVITEGEMKAALDRFYESSLRTPLVSSEGHGLKIWKNASQGIPAERPEERIQGRAVDHLRAKFPRTNLRAEPVTEDGRADITMFIPVLSAAGYRSLRYDWVLELKALCDRTSNGNTVAKVKCAAAVKSGLEQVVAYRENLNAGRGALCCYDMRAANGGSDACFAKVKDDASAQNIPLWHWYLYRSTRESRSARQLVSA